MCIAVQYRDIRFRAVKTSRYKYRTIRRPNTGDPVYVEAALPIHGKKRKNGVPKQALEITVHPISRSQELPVAMEQKSK